MHQNPSGTLFLVGLVAAFVLCVAGNQYSKQFDAKGRHYSSYTESEKDSFAKELLAKHYKEKDR